MVKEDENKFYITNSNGKKEVFTVGAQGSLGILALGHVGIRAWKIAMAKEKIKKNSNNKEKE